MNILQICFNGMGQRRDKQLANQLYLHTAKNNWTRHTRSN